MGYKVGGGWSPREKTHCGLLWWRKTCHWIETGFKTGSYDEWFREYPLGDYPKREEHCTTCNKTRWQ